VPYIDGAALKNTPGIFDRVAATFEIFKLSFEPFKRRKNLRQIITLHDVSRERDRVLQALDRYR